MFILDVRCLGSIPAHTGERFNTLPIRLLLGVYPRTYGGTSQIALISALVTGLSPHIRGNV